MVNVLAVLSGYLHVRDVVVSRLQDVVASIYRCPGCVVVLQVGM